MRVKSNIRLLMAYNGYKSLRSLGQDAGISWEILKKLDENKNIDTIRLKNLLKLCEILKCTLSDLIVITYDKDIDLIDYKKYKLKESGFVSNLNLLMALNNIKNDAEMERFSGVSWKVIKKLDSVSANLENMFTIELQNILKVCMPLGAKIDDLLNIPYEYDIKEYNL